MPPPPYSRDPDTTAAMQQQLASEMRSLMSSMDAFGKELHANALALTKVQAEVGNMKDSVDMWNKTLRDGAAGGLFGRMAVMEQMINTQCDENDDRKRDIALMNDEVRKSKVDPTKILTALITAGASLIAALLAVLVSFLKK